MRRPAINYFILPPSETPPRRRYLELERLHGQAVAEIRQHSGNVRAIRSLLRVERFFCARNCEIGQDVPRLEHVGGVSCLEERPSRSCQVSGGEPNASEPRLSERLAASQALVIPARRRSSRLHTADPL